MTPTIALNRKTLTTPLHTAFYLEAGRSDGPLIVLVHGFPVSGWTRHHQLTHFAAAGYQPVSSARSERTKLIDAYTGHLHRRWAEGCTDAARLYEEITALGFTGSERTVRRY